jgi:hypothetical protein
VSESEIRLLVSGRVGELGGGARRLVSVGALPKIDPSVVDHGSLSRVSVVEFESPRLDRTRSKFYHFCRDDRIEASVLF